MALQPSTERASQQGDNGVDECAGEVKEHTQGDDLQGNRTVGWTGELGQECQEEERDFGVEYIGDDTLRKDTPQRRLRDLWRVQRVLTAQQPAYAQVD